MKTICFTGHRPKDLHGYADRALYQPLTDEIERIIKKLRDQNDGVTVITGGAQGVDMIAGFVASRLMVEGRLGCRLYIPCFGQDSKWSATGLFSQAQYAQLLARYSVEQTKYLKSRAYVSPQDMTDRNHAMVNDSDIVVAIYNHSLEHAATHKGSGTAECIRYAQKMRKPILHHNTKTGKTTMYAGVEQQRMDLDTVGKLSVEGGEKK